MNEVRKQMKLLFAVTAARGSFIFLESGKEGIYYVDE